MRPSWDHLFMEIAFSMSEMGTCARRQVGCVLVDESHRVMSTGFNGVPPKWPHCRGNDGEIVRCPGADAPSGTNLDLCVANHAETNALLQCKDVMRATTCYVTTSPCISCVKMLLCTGVSRIVFYDDYPQPEAKELWTRYSLVVVNRLENHVEHRTWEKYNQSTGMYEIVASSGFSK